MSHEPIPGWDDGVKAIDAAFQKKARQAHSLQRPCSVERTNRSVIEHKLLTALEDGNTVAILATRADLEDMLYALENANLLPKHKARCKNLADGIRQLMTEAFPPNDQALPR